MAKKTTNAGIEPAIFRIGNGCRTAWPVGRPEVKLQIFDLMSRKQMKRGDGLTALVGVERALEKGSLTT